MQRFKLISGSDLARMADKEQTELDRLVKVQNDHIGFPTFGYWIPLKDIKTHQKLVSWTEHLLGKEWITKPMLHEFLRKVGSRNQLNIYGC